MNQHEMARKLQTVISTYGVNPQVDMAIEECSELTKALLKYRRKPTPETRNDIIDELADVQIMLHQMNIIFGCAGEVESMIDYKINRQIERIRTVFENAH